MGSRSAVQDLIQSSEIGQALIGHTVVWRLSGVWVSHADLESSLKSLGLEKYLPKPPSQVVSLNRAVNAWRNDKIRDKQLAGGGSSLTPDDEDEPGSGTKIRSLVRKIDNPDSEWLVYSVVLEQVDLKQLGLSYGTSLRVCLHRKKNYIKVVQDAAGQINDNPSDGQTLHEETALMSGYWNTYRNRHVAVDLGRLLKELMRECHAVSIRPSGGAYFVPISERENLRKLEGLVDNWSANSRGSYLLCSPIASAPGSNQKMSQAVSVDLMKQLEAMEKDMAEFILKDASGETVRRSTMLSRMAEFKNMQAKTQVLADILDSKQMQEQLILRRLQNLGDQAAKIIRNSFDVVDE